MKRSASALALLTTLVSVNSSPADPPKFELPRLGIFRKKKEDTPPPAAPAPAPAAAVTPKAAPTPAQPEATAPQVNPTKTALEVLKSDTDEKRRAKASETLRTSDPRLNADLIPTLMNSLQQDPSASVRASVAETIGKLKPVSQQAGAILEQAVVADPSEPVRKAAQQALWQYHLNGYRSSSANSAIPQTAEPPLAKPKQANPKPPAPITTVSKAPSPVPSPLPPLRPITTGIGKGAIYPQTIEPPLAKERVSVPAVEKIEPQPEAKPQFEVKPPMPVITVPPLPMEVKTPMPVITVPPLPTEVKPTPSIPAPNAAVPVPPAISPLVPSIPPPGK